MIYTMLIYNIFFEYFSFITCINVKSDDFIEKQKELELKLKAGFFNGDIILYFEGDYRNMTSSEIVSTCKKIIKEKGSI